MAGRGSLDGGGGGRAREGSMGGAGGGDGGWGDTAAVWGDTAAGRGSWAEQVSEMSMSGRDSLPQEGGRTGRVRRAVRISSIVAQEVRVCVCVCLCVCFSFCG